MSEQIFEDKFQEYCPNRVAEKTLNLGTVVFGNSAEVDALINGLSDAHLKWSRTLVFFISADHPAKSGKTMVIKTESVI